MPRSAHGAWTPPADRADPVDILIDQGKSRFPELLPIRYGRMRADPFAFLRGAAAVMAADLAPTPAAGIRMQACGDAHLANFGSYATPEGLPVFDINDFDETLPAPSSGTSSGCHQPGRVRPGRPVFREGALSPLAPTAARSFREHMADLAGLLPLTAWNRRIDLARAIADIDDPGSRRGGEAPRPGPGAAPSISGWPRKRMAGSRIREKPPLVYHLSKHALPARKAFVSYAKTLQEDRRVLLHRHTLRDVAFKAVGVGSVGTFCAIGLLTAGDGSPLLLQIKEAQESVLAPFAGASDYATHGERVVVGQRMMQAATDVFLGWTRAPIDGRSFYIRRLKDSRLADIGTQLRVSTAVLRVALRSNARAGACAGRRPGPGVGIHRKGQGIRRSDQRVCRGLRGPNRDGLAGFLGGDQSWPHHCCRAGNEEALIYTGPCGAMWASLLEREGRSGTPDT